MKKTSLLFWSAILFFVTLYTFRVVREEMVSAITLDDLNFQKMLEEYLQNKESVPVEDLYPGQWDYVFLFYGDSGTSRLKSVSCILLPTNSAAYDVPHLSREMELPKDITEGTTALIFVHDFRIVALFSLNRFAPDGFSGTCIDKEHAVLYVSRVSNDGVRYFWLKRKEG